MMEGGLPTDGEAMVSRRIKAGVVFGPLDVGANASKLELSASSCCMSGFVDGLLWVSLKKSPCK